MKQIEMAAGDAFEIMTPNGKVTIRVDEVKGDPVTTIYAHVTKHEKMESGEYEEHPINGFARCRWTCMGNETRNIAR